MPSILDSSSSGINKIINGSMAIDQRYAGAGISAANALNAYGVDRWRMDCSQSNKYNAGQNQNIGNGPPGFPYYLDINILGAWSPGSSDYMQVHQEIEGLNCADLGWGAANAKPVTLSFWVNSRATGVHSGSLRNALSATRSYVFTYTVNSAVTWEYKTVTIPGDTAGAWALNNGVGISLSFTPACGSTYSTTPGSWTAGNFIASNTAVNVFAAAGQFGITGVQLEVGSTASKFDQRSFGQELALCQRYCRVYDSGNTSIDVRVQGNNAWVTSLQLSPTMRIAPVLDLTFLGSYKNSAGGPGANQWQIQNISSGASVTWSVAPTVLAQTTQGIEHTYTFQNSGSGPSEAISGQMYNLNLGSGSRFYLQSEF